MPNGKKAGERCIHLTQNLKCAIFLHPDRPMVCSSFKAEKLICGNNRQDAMRILTQLEGVTE